MTEWKKGRSTPKNDKLAKIADYFGVSLDWLIGRTDVRIPQGFVEYFDGDRNTAESAFHAAEWTEMMYGPLSPSSIRIPVLGSVPAGLPLEAIEDIIDWEELPASMASGGREYFGLQVKGNSMYPQYLDGDVLIVRKQPICDSGDDAIVLVDGSDAVFKRVRLNGGMMTLQPLNPEYEPRTFTAQEIKNLPVQILGVVVELRRKTK